MRDRATRPRYGDQTACRYCGSDIEYHGRRRRRNDGSILTDTMIGGWSDRGGGDLCHGSRHDENGIPVPFKVRLHKPMSDR